MLKRHPFFKLLLKIILVITVSITTFVLCFVVLFIVLTASLISAASVNTDDFSSTLPKSYKTLYGEKESTNKLLSVRVSGVILTEKEGFENPLSFLESGVTYGYDVKKELYDAAKDESIKGVILEINSPGGTITGSHAIADGVAYYKKVTNKPVISFISGLGASGGYWSSIAADYVIADYGSTIGSIGVIFGPFKYYDQVVSEDGGAFLGGVVTQNGIETTYFTAGKSKDIGNPYRQLTTEETRLLQQLVNNEYDEFVRFVAARRKIPGETIRNSIGALVYDNKLAEQNRLIDATMHKEASYEELADRIGVKDDNFQIVAIKREPGIAEALFGAINQIPAKKVGSICSLSSVALAYHGNVNSLCQ
ncbi:MAG: S49 family peptidase [Candidatus Levybacteria bacterium]|nr:S49 family peptidase [Candidatus Levybacteria bacterium]